MILGIGMSIPFLVSKVLAASSASRRKSVSEEGLHTFGTNSIACVSTLRILSLGRKGDGLSLWLPGGCLSVENVGGIERSLLLSPFRGACISLTTCEEGGRLAITGIRQGRNVGVALCLRWNNWDCMASVCDTSAETPSRRQRRRPNHTKLQSEQPGQRTSCHIASKL